MLIPSAVYESGPERRNCYVCNLDTKQQNYFALFGKRLCLCPTWRNDNREVKLLK
jgi:hypothetical protein